MNKLLLSVLTIATVFTYCMSSSSRDSSAFGSEHSRPLKCVYFVPADCKPYPDRAERLFRVMTCVQDFYRKEMVRNGFGAMTFGLEEARPGELKLYEVYAPEDQEAYGRESYWKVRDVVVKELEKQGVDASKEVIVIFQLGLRWEGNKAIEVASFVGAGSAFNGTAWFYDDPMLDSEKLSSKEPGGYYMHPCSIGEFNTHYIGGIAHELGHALTLPHDCELTTENLELGYALMGGGNHTFGRELRNEGKGAFLTYSEALRLSVVPAITGQEPQRRPVDVELVDMKASRVSDKAVLLKGKIKTEKPVLGLVFYEDLDSRSSDYDAKTWVIKPEDDGSFEVVMTEVAPEPSELRVSAVRDIDTVKLASFTYCPDGADNEFEPLERSFQLKKISAALVARDVDALNALVQNDFAQNEKMKTLCEAIVQTISNSTQPIAPSKVADDVKEFDLSYADFLVEQVGWFRMKRCSSLEGDMLVVGDEGYATGLCAHAPSVLKCELGKKWKKFQFACGLQDNHNGSVEFVVRGDDKELFRCSAKLGQVYQAEVDVDGVQNLELIVEDGDDGKNSDHSVWAKPVLSR